MSGIENMIVLDLEWNRGYDTKPLNEILQIGAVRLDRLGGPVLSTFNAYIKPVVHKKFDPGARALPELKASKESSLDFAGALDAFRTWCGGDTAFAGWGGGDIESLNENCRYWGLPPVEAEEVFDFQRAFSHALGTDRQLALWWAAGYCGVPDVFDYHDALNDAMYTAVLSAWLTPEDLAWRPEPAPPKRRRPSPRLSKFPFPQQPHQKTGPFPTPEDALDAWENRRPCCPLCGRVGIIARWRPAAPGCGDRTQRYHAVFSCPEHGRFLCRMTLAQGADGQWQGRRYVPAATPEAVREYSAASEEDVYICKGQQKRRKRRSRRGSDPAC